MKVRPVFWILLLATFLVGIWVLFFPNPTQDSALRRTWAVSNHVDSLVLSLTLYRNDIGHLPSESEGLSVLAEDPGLDAWGGPYTELLLVDIWGNPYHYRKNDGLPSVSSSGPDGRIGTDDDIVVRVQEEDPEPAHQP